MVPPAAVSRWFTFQAMQRNGRLKLVQGCGDELTGDAAEAGFTVLLEIWHSAIAELIRDMPPDQLRILLIIDSAGSTSLRRLADALRVSTPAASMMCDPVEAAGLLRRSRAAPGSGVIMISETAAGRRLVARIREQRRSVLDYVLQSLSPDGRESLTRALSEFGASPAAT